MHDSFGNDRWTNNVPPDCTCPITGEVMTDPVVAADGHSYERKAIAAWFALGKRTSPKTNESLPRQDLLPNHALRAAIEDLTIRMAKLRVERAEMQTVLDEVLKSGACAGGAAASHHDVTSPGIVERANGNDSFDAIRRAGWLRKRSRYLRKWRLRYVVLDHATLRTFETASEATVAECGGNAPQLGGRPPTEDILLRHVISTRTAHSRWGVTYVQIRFDFNLRRSDMWLSADSPDEAKSWSNAIHIAALAARHGHGWEAPAQTAATPRQEQQQLGLASSPGAATAATAASAATGHAATPREQEQQQQQPTELLASVPSEYLIQPQGLLDVDHRSLDIFVVDAQGNLVSNTDQPVTAVNDWQSPVTAAESSIGTAGNAGAFRSRSF